MDPNSIQRWLNPHWRDRLEAWWEGYDLAHLYAQAKEAKAMRAARWELKPTPRRLETATAAVEPPPAVLIDDTPPALAESDEDLEARQLEGLDIDRRGKPVWSAEQVRGAQMLWGDDFVGPGDAQFMVDAVRPFGLNPAKSVLDCSAGLGGAARAIVGAYDTWVTALEPSPLLAKLGMRRSEALDLGRKAPVMPYDPECFNPAGSYDLVLADRILHRVRDKGPYLDHLCECVKPKGSALLMDYVIDGAPASWDSWNAWKDTEPLELYPWTAQRMKDELVQRNMDVRIVEDITAKLRRLIVERVRWLADTLQNATVDRGLMAGLARELQLWWARLKVLGHGLRYYRFVALKPA
ncbi:MAG TPA: methyltransferase domain-containing protein [Azospirillum sp.]|nr:methyltransferase domain-containing protein [Azospirillum sp.]